MADLFYRVYADGVALTGAQLDRFEDVTVTLGVQETAVARLRFPLFLHSDGTWSDPKQLWGGKAVARIRIEVKIRGSQPVALIDGPVAGYEAPLSSDPGQSFMTMVVYDDGYLLGRKESVTVLEKQDETTFVSQLFALASDRLDTDLDQVTIADADQGKVLLQMGTALAALRAVAERCRMYLFVTPGDGLGDRSVGHFKSKDGSFGSLSDLILVGQTRNITKFEIQHDTEKPGEAKGGTVGTGDKSPQTLSSSEEDAPPRSVRADSGNTGPMDLGDALKLLSQELQDNVLGVGELFTEEYRDVLRPYYQLNVWGISENVSGVYQVKKVTHTLTRSVYSQSFTLRRLKPAESPVGYVAPPSLAGLKSLVTSATNALGRIF